MLKDMKTQIYNIKNEVVGNVDIKEEIFNQPWNSDLVHQVITAIDANSRQNIAHTKGRGEVSGGGKKPWRQKGTGRARHGSIRSPLWKGGGTTFGPNKDRNFTKKINKKMLRLALYVSLSKKLKDGNLKIVDSLNINQPKTKELKWVPASSLLVPSMDNKNINRASSNIPKVKSLSPDSLNVKDVIRYKNIFIDQRAVENIR